MAELHEWQGVLLDLAHLLKGPTLVPYPKLRDEWAHMRCRTFRSKHCLCGFCRADKANRNVKESWQASQNLRPHRKHEHPFGSLNAALELLLRVNQDGYSARSVHEGMMARCQAAAELGTDVQTTIRTRDDLATRRANYAIDVERGLQRAFRPIAEAWKVEVRGLIALALSTVDPSRKNQNLFPWEQAFKLSNRNVKKLIGECRNAATVELAAIGLIPLPHERVGLDERISERMDEIEGRGNRSL